MLKNIKLFGFLVLFLTLFRSDAAKAILISPPVMEIEADPGSSIERAIEVGNETDQERIYVVGVKKFEMTGEEGQQKFISAEEGDDFGLTSWIKYEEKEIVIPSKGSKNFVFTIEVPKSADPGGHYASIYFSSGKLSGENGEESKVGVEAQIHSLILVRVSGDILEKAEIESFEIEGDKTSVNRLPVLFVWRMKNMGNVHVRAQGNIEIKDMFWQKTELIDANPKNYRVLPGSARKIESRWGNVFDTAGSGKTEDFFQEAKKEFDNFAIGKYSAKLDIVYGKGNDNFLSREISFWVFPWRILLLSLIALAVFAAVIIALIKRYNKWIVKKHFEK